jgi:hypothetical protein
LRGKNARGGSLLFGAFDDDHASVKGKTACAVRIATLRTREHGRFFGLS